jgi:hypothetical protein
MRRLLLAILLAVGLTTVGASAQQYASTRAAGQVLFFSTAQVPTIAGTAEQTLWTYTLPAGTVDVNSAGIRVTIGALTAANANGKSLRFKVAGTTITDSAAIVAAPNNVGYYLVLDIYRSGASAQVITGAHVMSTTKQARATSTAFSWASTLALTITAVDTVDSVGDLTVTSVLVEKLPPM